MKYGDLILNRYYSNGFKYNHSRFRLDPIPKTGKRLKRKQRFYSYHRKPKTAQEKKWAIEFYRLKRSKCNLISAWNDKLRSDIRTRRSWKKKKIKKQWMKNKADIRQW